MTIELSEIECEEIVRRATKKENVKIEKFSVVGCANYNGFLGEYFRLKIDAFVNVSQCELNFFVKSLPMRDLKQRKMLEDTGIFLKEVKLYENLLLRLSELSKDEMLWCPKAFLFRDDLLVLDDMSFKGYKILPFQFKFDRAHVEATLRSLAGYHCGSIVYEDGSEKSIEHEFGKILFETSVDDIDWFHSGLRAIYDIAMERTRFGKSHHDLLENKLYEKLFGAISIMENSPHDVLKVLVHRDVWKNNLMFKFDGNDGDWSKPTHCVLLDFQTARYLPLTVDVLMAIICTTRKSHQKEFYDYYIRYYYEQLTKELEKFKINLSTKMSFDDYAKSCNYQKTFAYVYNVIVLMLTMIPREYFLSINEDKYRDFADGNRSKFILDFMNKDSLYEECLIEAVESAIEYIFELS